MSRRSYKQNCALARANDIVGDRWTLLLLRDLLISPRRFNELLASLKGMGTNLLAARLKELEAAAVIERQEKAGGTHVYAVTEGGRALEPAILALIRWGLAYARPNVEGDHHRDDWDLLALKSLFRPGESDGLSVCVQFAATGFEGWARITDREMAIGLGKAASADVTINGTIADLFLGTRNPEGLITEGKRESLRRFLATFKFLRQS